MRLGVENQPEEGDDFKVAQVLFHVVAVVAGVDVVHVGTVQVLQEVGVVDGGAGGAKVARGAGGFLGVILVALEGLAGVHRGGQGGQLTACGNGGIRLFFFRFNHRRFSLLDCGIVGKMRVLAMELKHRLQHAQDVVGGDGGARPGVQGHFTPAFAGLVIGQINVRDGV